MVIFPENEPPVFVQTFIINRGTGNHQTYTRLDKGLSDISGLAYLAEGNSLGKLGIFFLGQACLDYPAAVWCVISFHSCKPSMDGYFQTAQTAKRRA